jgi:hypothetical protein
MPRAEIVRTGGTHFVPMERPELIARLARELFA